MFLLLSSVEHHRVPAFINLLLFLGYCLLHKQYWRITKHNNYHYDYQVLNIQNHICIVLANREQNMFRLGFQANLKSACFKIQVQLRAEKGSVILPCSTDQELGSIDRKLQEQFFFCRFLNRPKPAKTFRVSFKLLHI